MAGKPVSRAALSVLLHGAWGCIPRDGAERPGEQAAGVGREGAERPAHRELCSWCGSLTGHLQSPLSRFSETQ